MATRSYKPTSLLSVLGMDSWRMSTSPTSLTWAVGTNRSVPQIAVRLNRLLNTVVPARVLTLTAPDCLLAAAANKVTGPGPVLFKQVREHQLTLRTAGRRTTP